MTESYQCTLVNGKTVDLSTTQGADAYLQEPNFSPFSKTLKLIMKMGKKKMNRQTKFEVKMKLCMFSFLFQNASEDVVDKVPNEEIVAWVKFLVWVLKERTAAHVSGKGYDELDSVVLNGIIPSLMHKSVYAIIETNLFGVLRDFCEAHKTLPCDEVSEHICRIVTNTICTYNQEITSNEKTYQYIEEYGILEQYLRCVTAPPIWKHEMINNMRYRIIYRILSELQDCQILIRKRFCKGTPCRKMLDAVLEGKAGHPTHKDPMVYQLLGNIKEIAMTIEKNKGGLSESTCRNCHKRSRNFLRCDICKTACYCSRECQVADWKEHKMSCTPQTKTTKSARASGNAMIMAFLEKHGEAVVQAFDNKMAETGLKRRDLVLELTFLSEGDGQLAPSLCDPPYFKIGITVNYYTGDRPEEPYWLAKDRGSPKYDKNIKGWVASMKGMHSKMGDDDMLICAMHPTGPSVLTMYVYM